MASPGVTSREEFLALSTYEGWVAWVGGSPIFEAVPWRPDLYDLEPDADPQYRREGRNTLAWEDVPHERVTEIELYFARESYDRQPVVRITKQPGADLRWLQMKLRAVQVEAVAGGPAESYDANVQRTRVQGYRIGYYNPAMAGMEGPPDPRTAPTLIYEVTRTGMERRAYNCHPCWPRPHGLGMSPDVLGMTRADIPPVPDLEGERP